MKPSQEKKGEEEGREGEKKEQKAPFILLQFCMTGLTDDNWLTLNRERMGQVVHMQIFRLHSPHNAPIHRAD